MNSFGRGYAILTLVSFQALMMVLPSPMAWAGASLLSSPDSSKQISICIPYAGADQSTERWAMSEQGLNWSQESLETERCTVAFAATELRHFLSRTAPGISWQFRETIPREGSAIVLGPAKRVQEVFRLDVKTEKDKQAYSIHSQEREVQSLLLLTGGGREGTLYAVYSYLEQLGWRWYAPGEMGEVAPPVREALPLTGWNVTSSPDFSFFRGFHAEYASMESVELFLWMARNRLNLWSYRPQTYALMKKLGFLFLSGGHVLEEIMNPDRPLPTGRKLFEEHPDWFAEVDGKRERQNAHRYQYCVSNEAATAFVASDIVKRLKSDWRWTDYQNIWLFDTWAGWCQCLRCRALGNDADRYLYFLAEVRRQVNQALARGELDRDIGMAMAAYEGTPSLAGPSHPVPEVLTGVRDFVLFAPINRCYAHRLGDPRCSELNEHYAQALQSWKKDARAMPLTVVEYYNVSKFEDLPLLFSRTMADDFSYYYQSGVRGISYMHIPMKVWGPRALNHALFARLSWDTKSPVDQIKEDYFSLYYGPVAQPMHDFYQAVEDAYANITPWRNWLKSSVTSMLSGWNGEKPEKPLLTLNHLQFNPGQHREGEKDQAINPQHSLELLKKAADSLRVACQMEVPTPVRRRVEEDARLFRYGDESFRLYFHMTRLYEAERAGERNKAETIWAEVKNLADSLSGYYVPFDYEWPGAGVSVKDGLTRTQLRPLVERLEKKYAKGRERREDR
jgi:Domain of unknown function (DUF4838)